MSFLPLLSLSPQVGNLCNNSHVKEGTVIGSPTEGALLIAATKYGMADLRHSWRRMSEIPFS